MSKKVSMPFYYDWEEALEDIPEKDFKPLVLSMVRYHKDGTPPPDFALPDFDSNTKMAAKFIFPQIDRAKVNAENGRKGGKTTQSTSFGSTDGSTDGSNTNTNILTNTNTNTNTNTATSNPPIPPKGAEVFSARFCIFWNDYPKKVGKAAAEKAFLKLKPSAEMLQKMLDAIHAQKQSEQWSRDNGQFIPHPATWLNRGQWEDEVTAPQNQKADMSLEDFFA